jgi:phosphoglycolate phosphatase-like HAD superfamily hydrolase
MDVLVDEARLRGGHPETAAAYTQQFLEALYRKSEARLNALAAGQITADDLLVPGARAMLNDLASRGVQLTLASGTAVKHVKREAALLQIDHFFEGRIFGPGEDPRIFSKFNVMQQTLEEAGHHGGALIGFGDGYVEIENVKQLGGIAVGCATDEEHRSGRVEEWKRTRLIQAGADVIVGDYSHWPKLAEHIFAN